MFSTAAAAEGAVAGASSSAQPAVATEGSPVHEAASAAQALSSGDPSKEAWAAAKKALQSLSVRMGVDPTAVADEALFEAAAGPGGGGIIETMRRAGPFLDSLPAATRQQLVVALLKCFLPPPREEASTPTRYQQTEAGRRAAVALVRAAVPLLLREQSLLFRTLTTVAMALGAAEVQLSQAPLTLGANTHNHERHGAGEGLLPQSNSGEQARDDDKPDAMAAARAAAAAKAYAKRDQHMHVEYLALVRALLLFDLDAKACLVHLMLLAQILYESLRIVTEEAAFMHICDCITMLATAYPQPMRAFSRILLVPLLQHALVHRKPRVRVAAVVAVWKLVPCGAAEMIRDLAGFRENNVIDIASVFSPELGLRVNYMGRLVADTNGQVRERFAEMLRDWILHMHDRADYETLIWPYVLSGLSDPLPSIRAIALDALERAGEAYTADELAYRTKDAGLFREQRLAEDESRAHFGGLPVLLFEPFTKRPSWGSRQIGRVQFDRLYYAILQEVRDWKAGVANQSWTLLRVFLQLTEEHATKLVSDVAAALVGVLDEDLQREQQVVWDCAALCGRYTDPQRLVAVLAAQIEHAASASNSRRLVSALRVAAYVLPFIPPQHPTREVALDSFVERVLQASAAGGARQADYLAHERPVFEAYVRVVAGLLQLPGLSLGWKDRHANGLFRVLLEIAAWSQLQFTADAGSGSRPAAAAAAASSAVAQPVATPVSATGADAHLSGEALEERAVDVISDPRIRLQRRIDLCYRWLLRQYDSDEEGDLVLLLQLRLSAWSDVLLADSSSWSERSLPFRMLLEVLQRVAQVPVEANEDLCALFVQLPEQALRALDTLADEVGAVAPSPLSQDCLKACKSDSVRLSLMMQAALLRLLARPAEPSQLPLLTALLPLLTACVTLPQQQAFASGFLRGISQALLRHLPVHSAHFASLRAAHAPVAAALKALRLPSFDELKGLQSKAQQFDAHSDLFARFVVHTCEAADALRTKRNAQQQRATESLPPLAPIKERPLFAAADGSAIAALEAWLA